jgi:hypothetical protein
LLSSILATAEKADGDCMAEIEALLERLQSQVALADRLPANGRSRFLA